MAFFNRHSHKDGIVNVSAAAPAVKGTTASIVSLPLTIGQAIDDWAESEGELAIDVYVLPTSVVVRSAMAGVKPEDLSISLHNDLLTIRGHRNDEEVIERSHYVVQECHWGVFSRSVVLPVAVEADGAEAVIKNGVLKVTLRRASPTAVTVRLVEE